MDQLFKERNKELKDFSSWLKRDNKKQIKEIPDNVFKQCDRCKTSVPVFSLEENGYVCPNCHYHFKMSAPQRIKQLVDDKTFKEYYTRLKTVNRENFPEYDEKLDKAKKASGLNEAVVCGTGKINGIKTMICVMDSHFMMGSMGKVVGEKITRSVEHARKRHYPLIIVCTSGGARMQEGIDSLMQMAKVSAALKRFSNDGGLYISILTNPTTGGVSASFAMLGDIIIAEPEALIGFAGKRVIQNMIKQELPDDFQSAEFLLDKGFVDMIVERNELKKVVSDLLKNAWRSMMSLIDIENQIDDLKAKRHEASGEEYDKLTMQIEELEKTAYTNLTAWDRVSIARSPKRSKAEDLIHMLFNNFYELHGDRRYGDDKAIIGGIGYFHDMPVTVIAQAKGKTTKENIDRRFGMSNPEGYRKALRLAKQAEKFHRPIITIVDTAGAYPGKEAEERGQAQAIAECLYEFSDLNTPIICIVLSEGGSGGALALSVADRILMLENAVYSILSPEGFASILWKDDSRAKEAAEVMKLTSYDLYEKGIVDYLVKEPAAGIQADTKLVLADIDRYISQELDVLMNMSDRKRLNERYEKFRKIGSTL